MNDFLIELNDLLQDVLNWADNFHKGRRDYNFDVDDELYKLSEKHQVDFEKGKLNLIYNLLDFYCDAVKHGFKIIDEDYSVQEAYIDIKEIIYLIKESEHSGFELTDELNKRLSAL